MREIGDTFSQYTLLFPDQTIGPPDQLNHTQAQMEMYYLLDLQVFQYINSMDR